MTMISINQQSFEPNWKKFGSKKKEVVTSLKQKLNPVEQLKLNCRLISQRADLLLDLIKLGASAKFGSQEWHAKTNQIDELDLKIRKELYDV